MPSVKTHDVITLVTTPVAAALGWFATFDVWCTGIVTAAAVFGGYMFGPDLDIVSAPYRRWGPFRALWYPYQKLMPHRSRFSHGLVFGTLIRVVYFSLVVAVFYSVAMILWDLYVHDVPASTATAVERFGRVYKELLQVDNRYLLSGFLGLWFGGAVHTITDICGSLLKALWKAL